MAFNCIKLHECVSLDNINHFNELSCFTFSYCLKSTPLCFLFWLCVLLGRRSLCMLYQLHYFLITLWYIYVIHVHAYSNCVFGQMLKDGGLGLNLCFICCFAFAYVADLSDGDNFYLHCSFCRGQMGWGWGWALINQV